MKKIILLVFVTLFCCIDYSQAQTTEKKMTRQEKKEAVSYTHLIFNRTEFILASLQMTEERKYAALYELRLFLTLHSHLVHICLLYTSPNSL